MTLGYGELVSELNRMGKEINIKSIEFPIQDGMGLVVLIKEVAFFYCVRPSEDAIRKVQEKIAGHGDDVAEDITPYLIPIGKIELLPIGETFALN